MRRCSTLVALLLALAESAAAQTPTISPPDAASAAREPIEGHVLAVQEADVILDLSAARGLSPGDSVELWRPLSLKHPVTGSLIKDRFRIGTLSITQARPHLSLAITRGKLERTPEPGDIVIVPAATPTPAPANPPASTSPPSISPTSTTTLASFPEDPDAAALSALFDSLRREPLEARIARFAAFIRDNPRNRHTPALREHLRELDAALRVASSRPSPARIKRHAPPDLALAGHPLTLGIQLDEPQPGTLIHYRTRGESTFQTLPGNLAGPRYFTFTIPGAAVTEAGLEYFIEAADAAGSATALAGTSESPVKVRTRRDWDLKAPDRPGATAQLAVDYADYNRLRNNDRDLRIEADFGLRLGDEGLRALRSGFGVYRGVGGTLTDLDELGKSAREVGLTYGYLEAEYAPEQSFAFIVRALLGLDDSGVNSGLQAHLRIGSDRVTNVTLGGELLGNVGVRGITQLSIAPLSRVPIVLRSEVGNQPAGVVVPDTEVRPLEDGASLENTSTGASDVGVRGIVQAGYRFLPELVVSVRASYQGRNINHSGPGLGAAVSYTW